MRAEHAERRWRRTIITAGLLAVFLTLAACSSDEADETDASAEDEAAGSDATEASSPSTEETTPPETTATTAPPAADTDLVDTLLAAELPSVLLGLTPSAGLEPEVEQTNEHFLVCPVEDAEVSSVRQTDYPDGAATLVREFLLFDTADEAAAYLVSVEAESGPGCQSELLRDDGTGRTSAVEDFEPVSIDGADGFRSVIVQEILGRFGFSTVVRLQVQEGSVVIVATDFGGQIDSAVDLELLVQDGLELVRSAQ